ncbi:serine/threonine-protein kinase [Allonocardiopsis opalescens]|uniref:non-specific serine/threonine protein kinase n=2 Tax=Allonocardiopsis opalescens TaxID=1144618 RepID=A0A2T0Q715_9ACTN|nr:serine/threonine-protein kinase [Allonocardiopsis opalescens]
MAEVYRARDVRLDRTVAIKTLRSDLARDQTFQARFRREAQSAASLNHPAIIAVYDTGEDNMSGTPVPYIVMEFADGRTLRELLQDDRRLLPERAAEITDGILRALEYSHRNGIVHRDIKPANVMLTRNGDVKVMDFGIARSMSDAQATMTATAQVIGTAQYLSPEQARGERVDARSDLYSTGCLLYELLTGRPPFTGDSPVSIAYQHVREDPVPPSRYDPDIPAWLDDVVLKAMTKDANYRYQSAAEFRADLQAGLAGRPVAADGAATMLQGAAATIPPVRDDEYDDYDDYDDREGRGKTIALWTVLAVLVLGALGFLGWMFLNPGTEMVRVPDVAGESVEDATAALTEAGFTVASEVQEEPSAEVEEGRVIDTDPPMGEDAPAESEITLIVSAGPEEVEIPDVSGDTEAEAREALEELGLVVNTTTEEGEGEPGTVIETDPAAGETVAVDSEVTLVLVATVQQVEVPDVVNQSEDAARQILEGAGFSVEVVPQERADVQPGVVFQQTPQGGGQVAPESTVTIYVAQAPPETEEPPPTENTPTPDPEPTEEEPDPNFPFPPDPGGDEGD